MEKEKKYFGGWVIWITFLVIMISIIVLGLSSLGIIGQTIVKRMVFEQSYQKKEADKTGLLVYSAQLAQLRAKLSNPNLDEVTRVEIQAQINAINILKLTKED